MSEMYRPYKIPSNNPSHGSKTESESYNSNLSDKKPELSFSYDQHFAEIEINGNASSSYNSAPVPSPAYPAMDPKRRLFKEMREIAWNNHSSYVYNLKFYNKNTQHENSRVFYKQAVFMKDIEDDYTDWVDFSSYYPYYQLMNYEQLRTYFSWRSLVRTGIVEEVSLSYAFVYVYELLNNIGIDDPADGLKKLMTFRKAYKRHDATIDKYLIKWIKDYYVYYQLEASFKDFIYEYNLEGHFPEILEYEPDLKGDFESLSELSKYNIRQSAFYKSNSSLVRECLEFVINRLKSILADAGLDLYNIIYEISNKKTAWTPFKGALFYPRLKQPAKTIILSLNEAYICEQNMWFLSSLVCTNSGRQLMTYIFKQTEAVLRTVTGYKHKLSVGTDIIDGSLLQMLANKGISIEKTVTDAVKDFHREKNKIVVSVDPNALSRIRTEALYTQQKLIVPEDAAYNSAHMPDIFSWLNNNVSVSDNSLTAANTAANTAGSADLSNSRIHIASALTDKQSDEKSSSLSDDFLASSPVLESGKLLQKGASALHETEPLNMSLPSGFQTAASPSLSAGQAATPSSSGSAASPSLPADQAATPLSSGSAASPSIPAGQATAPSLSFSQHTTLFPAGQASAPSLSSVQAASQSLSGGWTSLRQALTDVEIAALSAVLEGGHDMKRFADEHGIMLELLADSINEKAFDHIGDSILELDDSMIIYDEYLENVKAMVIDE